MHIPTRVKQVLFDGIDDLNKQLEADKRIPKSLDVILTGDSAQIDSFSLVNLIVIIEEKVDSCFGVQFSLADEHAMLQEIHPLTSLDTLMGYITGLLEEQSDR